MSFAAIQTNFHLKGEHAPWKKKINFRNSSLGMINIKIKRCFKDKNIYTSMKFTPCKLTRDHVSKLQTNVTD